MDSCLRLVYILSWLLLLGTAAGTEVIPHCTSEYASRPRDGYPNGVDEQAGMLMDPCQQAAALYMPDTKDLNRQQWLPPLWSENHGVVGDNAVLQTAETFSSTNPPPMPITDSSGQRLVTVTVEMLSSLIKGSRVPPSGPSKDHNWAAAGLPEQTPEDATNSDAMFFRIQRVVSNNNVIGNDLPNSEEVDSSVTYRIQDLSTGPQ